MPYGALVPSNQRECAPEPFAFPRHKLRPPFKISRQNLDRYILFPLAWNMLIGSWQQPGLNLAGGSSCCVRRPGSGVSPANSQVALAEPVPWRGVSECSDVIYVEGTFYLYRYTLVKKKVFNQSYWDEIHFRRGL